MSLKFLMAGGGTGGHVMPLIAVARELRGRGHEVRFIGTRAGLEERLVPEAGFPIEYIQIGALKRAGAARVLRTLWQLPVSTVRVALSFSKWRPGAVFSLGGYAAGPVVFAAAACRIPIVVMEPNAIPGVTNRWMGRLAVRALVSFEQTLACFPAGKAEVAGVPIRPEFFTLPVKPRSAELTVLITGGSRGSRTLNEAARGSWPLFRAAKTPLRIIHQTGRDGYAEIAARFASAGVQGEVVPFIDDMPGAFAQADLVVCRSGASAVAEVAAAGKPAIFVPFPFAADDHQRKNAEAAARGGAARVVLDQEMSGQRLYDEVTALGADLALLERMGQSARTLARPGAAERAAGVLEEVGRRKEGRKVGR